MLEAPNGGGVMGFCRLPWTKLRVLTVPCPGIVKLTRSSSFTDSYVVPGVGQLLVGTGHSTAISGCEVPSGPSTAFTKAASLLQSLVIVPWPASTR